MEKFTMTCIKTYSLVILLQFLIGLSEATHYSNGFAERWSTNDYSKKPAEWTATKVSEYITNALLNMEIVNKTQEWPGVNAYYKFFVDQYASYVKSPEFVRLTTPPTGLNKYGKEFLGVCVNFQLLDPSDNSSVLGLYTCPLPFEPPQHTFCCGNDHAEYCCEPNTNLLLSMIAGPVIVGPICLGLFVVGVWSCCCKKKEKPVQDEKLMSQSSAAESSLGTNFKTEYSPPV